jgi:hypothetical protein
MHVTMVFVTHFYNFPIIKSLGRISWVLVESMILPRYGVTLTTSVHQWRSDIDRSTRSY